MNGTSGTRIKICGLQTEETVRAVSSLPIDYIGFIFAPSRRQVTPEQAGRLIESIREERPDGPIPKAAGVFVNPEWDLLQRTMEAAPLDVIQLHGQESPEYCSRVSEHFGTEIFKVISLTSAASSAKPSSSDQGVYQVAWEPVDYRDSVGTVLLDTHDPVHGGGSGRTFAWEAIPAYLHKVREAGMKLFVAGGLHPDNVRNLLDTYRPDGVDVSSGVETNGAKDLAKIQLFVERVIGQ